MPHKKMEKAVCVCVCCLPFLHFKILRETKLKSEKHICCCVNAVSDCQEHLVVRYSGGRQAY